MRQHIPVLLKETIEFLSPRSDSIFVDCTVGTGGHATEILKRIQPNGFLYGFDLDRNALSIAAERLKEIGSNFKLFEKNYRELAEVAEKEGFTGKVSGVLFDLGLSSLQVAGGYGMSFEQDEPLAMLFSKSVGRDIVEFLNTAPVEEIARVLNEFGEEPRANRIAERIVDFRQKEQIKRTGYLKRIVFSSFSRKTPYLRVKKALRRVFQALRIYANDELGNVEFGLAAAVKILKQGGRVAVISYHSLEDRIVKHFFKAAELKILTKKPIKPNEEEVRTNRRARSAKLRVAERV